MRLLVLVVTVGFFAVVGGAGAARSGPDGVVDCHAWIRYPNTVVSSARNMTCAAAVREMRRYRGSIHRRFRTPGGFVCYRVSGGPLGGQWRCVRGAKAFRFEFGD